MALEMVKRGRRRGERVVLFPPAGAPGMEGLRTGTHPSGGAAAAEGEIVEVIVIPGAHDAERYACASAAPGEFSDVEDRPSAGMARAPSSLGGRPIIGWS
jgi:hypothetical protein